MIYESLFCYRLAFVRLVLKEKHTYKVHFLPGIRESAFPSGPYAIPMSKDGCPEGPGYGWRKGNINITTRLSLYDPDSFPEGCREFVQDIRSILKPNNTSFRTNILGPFDRYTLQMNFCFKLPVNKSGNKTSWPRGNYGVYGSYYGCPAGMLIDTVNYIAWNACDLNSLSDIMYQRHFARPRSFNLELCITLCV